MEFLQIIIGIPVFFKDLFGGIRIISVIIGNPIDFFFFGKLGKTLDWC
jgi:hypothetical protein